jgi:hypothetical protein
MFDGNDGYIPLPVIKFTCTALSDALVEWQKNNGVPPDAFMSKANTDSAEC